VRRWGKDRRWEGDKKIEAGKLRRWEGGEKIEDGKLRRWEGGEKIEGGKVGKSRSWGKGIWDPSSSDRVGL
jgi:hypothetical protein